MVDELKIQGLTVAVRLVERIVEGTEPVTSLVAVRKLLDALLLDEMRGE